MKSILLYIENDEALDARVQAAMDLARHFDAHVTCLQPLNYEIFALGDFYGSAMVAAIPEIKRAAEELREKVEERLRKEDVIWEWRKVNGMAEAKLLEHSVLQDIIIVGPHELGREGDGPSYLIGQLALNAPVPILVIPKNWKRFDPSAPTMVAWNGSPEACEALRASLSLLGSSSHVVLASVIEDHERKRFDFPPVDGAKYLSRHGIDAKVLDIPRGKAKVADTLFSAAETRQCGLMVMGAYGHSRLAEFLFGGVTRRALGEPQMPILLAH